MSLKGSKGLEQEKIGGFGERRKGKHNTIN